jgi:hypothetical protein
MIALRDLEANPYRHIGQYRIVGEKIERLLASYQESGFWHGSIQARPHPSKADKFQIAFGHHRVEAARRAKLGEIGVVVSPRDNATMLRMMATENAEEFRHNPLVTQETIGAVIDAYGAGEIQLEAVDPKAPKGSIYVAGPVATYTCQTVARFLGWTNSHGDQKDQPTRTCRIAFDAWHAQHQTGVNVAAYLQKIPANKQTTLATEAILTATKAATRQAKAAGLPDAAIRVAAHDAAKSVVREFKDETHSNLIENRAARIGSDAATKAKRAAGIVDGLPELPAFVLDVRDGLRQRRQNFLADIDAKLDPVLPYRDQLPEHVTKSIVKELRESAEEIHRRLLRSADAFDARIVQNVTPHPRKRLTA